MKNEHDSLIRSLDALLDVERQALLDGNLQALSDIVDEKERLIESLNNIEMRSEAEVAPINDKVERNQALLEQALSGIRSVARKLADIRQARKTFDTYDRQGQKNRIQAEAETSVEKRA